MWSSIPWSLIHKLVITSTLLDIKSCPHPHLYAACVIFGYGDYYLLCKEKFVMLQRESFVRMSCSHYIEIFHTHFTHPCHKCRCIKKSVFYMLWMVYVVLLSVPVCDHNQVLSLFIWVSLISHLASFSRNLASSIFLELQSVQEPQTPLAWKTTQWSLPVSFRQSEPTISRICVVLSLSNLAITTLQKCAE